MISIGGQTLCENLFGKFAKNQRIVWLSNASYPGARKPGYFKREENQMEQKFLVRYSLQRGYTLRGCPLFLKFRKMTIRHRTFPEIQNDPKLVKCKALVVKSCFVVRNQWPWKVVCRSLWKLPSDSFNFDSHVSFLSTEINSKKFLPLPTPLLV